MNPYKALKADSFIDKPLWQKIGVPLKIAREKI